jgi:hypothetical protein
MIVITDNQVPLCGYCIDEIDCKHAVETTCVGESEEAVERMYSYKPVVSLLLTACPKDDGEVPAEWTTTAFEILR